LIHSKYHLEETAQRRVDTAVVLAGLVGVISLVLALRLWDSRIYLDLETLLSLIDAILVLILAFLLARGREPAAWCLTTMALLGVWFTIWRGLPPWAMIPQLASGFFYARAIPAQRYLSRVETPPASHP
jgi:hypothetical protein